MSWKLRQVTHRSSQAEKKAVLRFSGGDYAWATRSRLESSWGAETYGMVAAFSHDRCVGTTSYTLSPRGQGILSQVYTDPDFRNQGIARATVGEAVQTFRTNGARAVYLASAKDWVQRLYCGFGFRLVGAMAQRHAFKLTLDPSGEDHVMFRSGQRAKIRPLAAGDQAELTALFNATHPCVVKHYGLGCYLGSHFEGEFYVLRRQADGAGAGAVVLDGEEGLLGLGTIMPSLRRHETHRGILDLLVHTNYAHRAGDMLDVLQSSTPLESLSAYIGDSEEDKRRLFEDSGYGRIARLERKLVIEETAYDLTLYERRWPPA